MGGFERMAAASFELPNGFVNHGTEPFQGHGNTADTVRPMAWNDPDLPQRLKTMKDQNDTGRGDRTAHLMLTEQSGAKPRSTGQLGCFGRVKYERCPLSWDDGSVSRFRRLAGEDTW
jgi:hypothetical protein